MATLVLHDRDAAGELASVLASTAAYLAHDGKTVSERFRLVTNDRSVLDEATAFGGLTASLVRWAEGDFADAIADALSELLTETQLVLAQRQITETRHAHGGRPPDEQLVILWPVSVDREDVRPDETIQRGLAIAAGRLSQGSRDVRPDDAQVVSALRRQVRLVPWVWFAESPVAMPAWLNDVPRRFGRGPTPIVYTTTSVGGQLRSMDFAREQLRSTVFAVSASAHEGHFDGIVPEPATGRAELVLVSTVARVELTTQAERRQAALTALTRSMNSGDGSLPTQTSLSRASDELARTPRTELSAGAGDTARSALAGTVNAAVESFVETLASYVERETLDASVLHWAKSTNPRSPAPRDLWPKLQEIGPTRASWPRWTRSKWPVYGHEPRAEALQRQVERGIEVMRARWLGQAVAAAVARVHDETAELAGQAEARVLQMLESDDADLTYRAAATLKFIDRIQEWQPPGQTSPPSTQMPGQSWSVREQSLLDDSTRVPSLGASAIEAAVLASVPLAIAVAFWFTGVAIIAGSVIAAAFAACALWLRSRSLSRHLSDWNRAREDWLSASNARVNTVVAEAERSAANARGGAVRDVKHRLGTAARRLRTEIYGLASLIGERLRFEEERHDLLIRCATGADRFVWRVSVDPREGGSGPISPRSTTIAKASELERLVASAWRRAARISAFPEPTPVPEYERCLDTWIDAYLADTMPTSPDRVPEALAQVRAVANLLQNTDSESNAFGHDPSWRRQPGTLSVVGGADFVDRLGMTPEELRRSGHSETRVLTVMQQPDLDTTVVLPFSDVLVLWSLQPWESLGERADTPDPGGEASTARSGEAS